MATEQIKNKYTCDICDHVEESLSFPSYWERLNIGFRSHKGNLIGAMEKDLDVCNKCLGGDKHYTERIGMRIGLLKKIFSNFKFKKGGIVPVPKDVE